MWRASLDARGAPRQTRDRRGAVNIQGPATDDALRYIKVASTSIHKPQFSKVSRLPKFKTLMLKWLKMALVLILVKLRDVTGSLLYELVPSLSFT